MKFTKVALGTLALFVALAVLPEIRSMAHAATQVTNAAELRSRLGLDKHSPGSHLNSLKIAVLDNGFSGFKSGAGLLPDSAEIIQGPGNAPSATPHGLGIAQTVWAMTGQNSAGPKFYLVNTHGFTNFKAAIDFVIREQVDIVLYSQVWPFGSNFDGSGFINEAVNRATRAGILWINAAGNFGGMTHEKLVKDLGTAPSLTFKSLFDENDVTLTLSWNDFADTENYNTPKDLDLLVYNEQGTLVGSSELIQRGEAPPASGESKLSSHARESLRLHGLERGIYRIVVREQSHNFSDSDRFRVVLEADKPGTIEFKDGTAGTEIFAPADNPNVITVGEDFSVSSRGNGSTANKPNVLLKEAIVSFSNGSTVRGSSTAAAIFTGVIAVLKAQRSDLNFQQLLTYLQSLRAPVDPSNDLTPASPKAWPPLPQAVTDLVPAGGRLMIHPDGHFVILVAGGSSELPCFRNVGPYRVEFRAYTGENGAPVLWRTPQPAELSRW